jgi:OmpA-OmpF porin, OOP family
MRVRQHSIIVAALGAALLATPGPVGGEPHSGVDSHLFRPAFDPNGIFSVEGGTILPEHDFSMKMGFGYGQTPFAVPIPGMGAPGDAVPVLDFAMALHITMGFALTDKIQLGVDTGLWRTDTAEGYGERARYRPDGTDASTGLIALRPLSNIDPSGDQLKTQHGLVGPFDVRLALKYQLVTGQAINLAVMAIAHIPFGDEEMFLGDANFVLEPRLAADYKLNASGSTRLTGNAGLRLRERTVLESYDAQLGGNFTPEEALPVYDLGPEAVAGAGVAVEILPQLSFGAETVWFLPLPDSLAVIGDCRLYDGSSCSQAGSADHPYYMDADYGDLTGYAMGGLNYRASPDVLVTLTGGAGLTGARAEAFRGMTMVTWAPTPAGTRVIGRGDRDGDGIPDSVDLCPDEPEDFDGFQDDDGCPDLDNDGDGILDASDACPNEAEDRDGFQDEDGCPDRDNDGDGIPDVLDRCPNEPEDFDGFEDDDGCPDEDNDGDGIPDVDDQCPNEPETVNGFQDDDGCPDDRMAGGPVLQADRIDLQGAKIDFRGNTDNLTPGSSTLLDQVARIIKGNASLVVRVEVHVPLSTRSTNRRTLARQKQRDKTLSQQRADAIVEYLLKQGVPAPQVQGVGLGSDVPIVAQDPQSELNERVDFIRVR